MDPRTPRLARKHASSLTTIVGTPPGASSLLQVYEAERTAPCEALVGCNLNT
jgi:hypothetical protein